jgi:hypothetical protein
MMFHVSSYGVFDNFIFSHSNTNYFMETFLDNTLIKIWVNVGTREALHKAEALLRDMKVADSVSLVTLIHGWSKTRFPEAASRAKSLFDELLQLPPSLQRRGFSITTVCNSVMSSIGGFSMEIIVPNRTKHLSFVYLMHTARQEFLTLKNVAMLF